MRKKKKNLWLTLAFGFFFFFLTLFVISKVNHVMGSEKLKFEINKRGQDLTLEDTETLKRQDSRK